MIEPQTYFSELKSNAIFKQWRELHSKSYLTHFFCQLNNTMQQLGLWEVGFFNPESDKITVFTTTQIKPEDDVFRKEATQVEELKLQKVKISIEKAQDIFKTQWQSFFPKQILGNGFLILQTLEHKATYNFTFITQALAFINLKIDAESGEITDHQTVNVLDKKSDNLSNPK